MTELPHLTILGGGPAGLAVAYFARKAGLPFALFEKAAAVGGHCVTFQHGDFRYDSGAHRFHNKIPAVTSEIRELMGGDLEEVTAPSQIFISGKLVNFPLAPLDLAKKLGPRLLAKAALDFMGTKVRGRRGDANFEAMVCGQYGRTIAETFLLGYSQKLWGLPGSALSPLVSGGRLKGLNLRALLAEMIGTGGSRSGHLDGAFLYPRLGFGMITQRLADTAGRDRIHAGLAVTRIRHDGRRILEIETNREQKVAVDELASTLPIGLLLTLLDPQPPAELLRTAADLKFRNLVLVALFLDQPSVTPNASVYFPETRFPFTRLYEPRNRSVLMAPPGKTSLVAELACDPEDDLWREADADVASRVATALQDIGWVKPEAILGTKVHRMAYAYPVLRVGYENTVAQLLDYLRRFENLKLAGRNALFVYGHLHDQIKSGHELVAHYV